VPDRAVLRVNFSNFFSSSLPACAEYTSRTPVNSRYSIVGSMQMQALPDAFKIAINELDEFLYLCRSFRKMGTGFFIKSFTIDIKVASGMVPFLP
jgi:hypothetical protein